MPLLHEPERRERERESGDGGRRARLSELANPQVHRSGRGDVARVENRVECGDRAKHCLHRNRGEHEGPATRLIGEMPGGRELERVQPRRMAEGDERVPPQPEVVRDLDLVADRRRQIFAAPYAVGPTKQTEVPDERQEAVGDGPTGAP